MTRNLLTINLTINQMITIIKVQINLDQEVETKSLETIDVLNPS